VVSSPNFTLHQGQWYRLTLDVATETDNQIVPLVVRRGGGGSNGYEAVSDRALSFTAGRTFTRHTVVFQATQTIVAADPVTGDLGARVDIDGITAGQSVSLANLELVPITPDALAQTLGALINVGSTARWQACPWAASQSAVCEQVGQPGRPAGAELARAGAAAQRAHPLRARARPGRCRPRRHCRCAG
jgi:hypothetical protein